MNKLIARAMMFNIIRLMVMVSLLVVWMKTVGFVEQWQRVLGIGLCFVAGHLAAFGARKWVEKPSRK